ncbi:AAA domain (dynein-related subfamily) [Actinomadura rubteroloni]|uniref:AAA domain (Dynein-related subfamily) n=1 Tax=Actinomadura rubteroloni TaxID=1926885 RepID=A0A2P4UN34_9ACTN|nr:AAA domain (dynein-related subfamily) [Actinomadura rubteroloni]
MRELEAEKTALSTRAAELDRRESALDERELSLTERSERVLELEEDAKRGFAGYRHEQLERLRGELDERRALFDAELHAREERLVRALAERESALARREEEARDREAELEAVRLEQQRTERRLAAREEYLEQEAADRADDLRAELEAELERERHNASSWRLRWEAVNRLAEERDRALAERDVAIAVFGGRSEHEIAEELTRLRAENAELRRDAAARPVADQDRVAELESRFHDLTVEREGLAQRNAELRRQVAAAKISTVERENSRMVNQALERLNETLRAEIHQQTVTLEQLQAESQRTSPFPSCFSMDADPTLNHRPPLSVGPVDLADLVTRVRHRMAADLGLFYSEQDMRCFVAGLATSRLHLLQGISGIGKTRLPEAFARVTGAGSETVAVAAEWRSPQDLVGYYNPFERKFYETDFMQALYRAQLPLFADKPFFIVLDEMNLSHPEQYFSDLLSALERKEGDSSERPAIRLLTARVDPAPALLRDGRSLELPDNVWFVGTANNDETTVRFADKTYDRAHILELPSRPTPFQGDDAAPLTPVSMRNLQESFQRAAQKHRDAARRTLDFFDAELGDRLRDDFGVSWGSRFHRQAERFVPVVVEARGTPGEAADHLLATKILRKLSGQVGVPAGELRALADLVEARWSATFPDTPPERSLRAIRAEIRARGAG